MGLALVACGGSEGTGPEDTPSNALEPFVGTWDAVSFVHTARDDNTLVIDIIAEGTSFVLTIQASGSYRATATLADQSQTETGTLRLSEGRLILTPISPPGPEDAVTYTLLGNTMTWEGSSEWDFASDGVPEVTSVRIVFQRR